MARKDSDGKGFVTKQERGRKRINTTVAVIVAAMAVIGIVGTALRGSGSSAQASSGSGTAVSEQAAAIDTAAVQQALSAAASSETTETVIAQSDEKTTQEETAVTAAGGSESTSAADTADTASEAGTAAISGTYTLPSDMNVYASADESGQVIAQLYAGNQVQVGESAGNGWYSVTVWVGTNGSYAQTSGYMKLQ